MVVRKRRDEQEMPARLVEYRPDDWVDFAAWGDARLEWARRVSSNLAEAMVVVRETRRVADSLGLWRAMTRAGPGADPFGPT